MKKPKIVKVQRDSSIPWFEQIKKTVVMPGNVEEQTYYAIKPSDYVTILAKTPEGEFIIVRQFRPVVEDYTFELPSGHVEEGETPSQAVARELREETNCIIKDVFLLGEIVPDSGRLENRLWAFYSDKVEVNEFPNPLKNEGIEVSLVDLDKLFEMMNNGEFNHALDLCVVALAISKGFVKIET